MENNLLFNAVKSLVPPGAIVESFDSKMVLFGEKEQLNKGCGFSVCCFESHFTYRKATQLFNKISGVLLSNKGACLERASFSAVKNMEWEYTMEFFAYNYTGKPQKAD